MKKLPNIRIVLHKISIVIVVWMLTGCYENTADDQNVRSEHVNYMLKAVEEETAHPGITADSCFIVVVEWKEDTLAARFLQEAGLILYGHSAYPQASDYFDKAARLYTLAELPAKAARMQANKAVVRELSGDYAGAVEDYLNVLDYFSVHGDSNAMAKVYTNLAVVYEELGMAQKSLQYNELALRIKVKNGRMTDAASNLNNMGVVHEELWHNADSALYYYLEALKIYEKEHQAMRTATTLNNLGRVLMEKGDLHQAELTLGKAMFLMDSLQSELGQANVYRNLGEIARIRSNKDQAAMYYGKAYSRFSELNDPKGRLEVMDLWSALLTEQMRYREAVHMMNQYVRLKDSVMNSDNNAAIAEMEARYQVREKNRAIEVLELRDALKANRIRDQRITIVLLVIIFLLLVASLSFLLMRNRLRQQQLQLELQHYLLKLEEMQSQAEYTEEHADRVTTDILRDHDITEREADVLQLLARGLTYAEIAEKLFVSTNTVKTHIKNIYVKLDVKNRMEAIRKVNAQ